MTLTPHSREKAPTWEVGTGPEAGLRRELNRAEARLRRSWRLTAAATVLALAAGGGWFADRWGDRLPSYAEQDVRDVLAAWAELLERSAAGATVTDAQVSAAGVLPGGSNVRDVLDSMRQVGREYEARSLQVSYKVDRIRTAPTAVSVSATMLLYDAGQAVPEQGDPREFTFLRTGAKPPQRDAAVAPEAAADATAAEVSTTEVSTTETSLPDAPPAKAVAPPAATESTLGRYVRLTEDRTGQHCCMPIFP